MIARVVPPPLRAAAIVAVALAALAAPTAAPAAPVEDPAALALVRAMQELLRADTNVAVYRIEVVRPDWRRALRLKSFDDRPGKRFFIRILAPRKDRDSTFLKVGGNLWMYLPKLERDIKIPPSMMLSSWMGSDFTNDDLVKSSSVVDDYVHRIVAREGAGPAEVVTVESTPRAHAAVVWGKLVIRIRGDGVPLDQDFYDERGKRVRRLTFEAVREMDGRRLPTRWVIEPLAKPGRRTVMEIEEIAFDIAVPERTFERANLGRRRR